MRLKPTMSRLSL